MYLPSFDLQVEVTKYEELEETHAELKLKQLLWDSLDEWDVMTTEWTEVCNVWHEDESTNQLSSIPMINQNYANRKRMCSEVKIIFQQVI